MAAKRKREENSTTLTNESKQEGEGGTLFVSNLPYTATSVDLQTLFSDIAPVRSAFVVLDKETGKSKGVGYVSFAIREDAKLAIEHIEKNGFVLDKRNLRVEYADRKSDANDSLTPSKPKHPRQPLNRSKISDPLAIRTVSVSGLPVGIDSKVLWKKFRKCNGAEKILQWPLKTESDEEDKTRAEILFSTPATAQEAISHLHAHIFKGSLMSLVLKKRLDTLVKSGNAPSKASRLIVRNLPWNTTEDDLRRLFLPHGPIYSITIPVSPPREEGEQPRAKGFGFVWMLNKQDAEKAIGNTDGTTLGPKNGDSNAKGKERIIAVDWALSKEKWNAEKPKIEEVDGSEGGSDEGEEDNSHDTGSDDDDEGSSESHNSNSEDEGDGELSNRDESDASHDKPQLPAPETGNTLFIRNLPFTATEDELRILFRTFGSLRYARITLDPATGRSRGTGFVCFWNKEDADKVIEKADLLKMETNGDQTAAPEKKNPFKLASILTPDPSSSLAQSLVLHGRTLDITRAVTREEAGRLREEGEKARQKQDKRNLYLMREGVIFPNTPAADTLTPIEVEKRVNSFNTRRQLVRSNPSLYISKTRLSVRQIPSFATERTLKRLALYAIRVFEDEVKNGTREGLSADELKEDEDIKKLKRKKGERPTAVRQAKIVRILEKVDPITGKGRSKGYGFLEMISHQDALRVIRWANNNPTVEPLMRDWWQEELKDILKKEEDVESKSEEQQTKINRIKNRLAELKEEGLKKSQRTLIIEFSIENIQVVRRRGERETTIRREPKAEDVRSEKDLETRPTKKRRVSVTESTIEQKAAAKPINSVGSIIECKFECTTARASFNQLKMSNAFQERRIVIIGGGIIGCTTAYYLTRHPGFSKTDIHITLLEASTIAAGASGKAGGLVAKWAYPRELSLISFSEHERLANLHDGANRWGWRKVACGQWEGRTREKITDDDSKKSLHGRVQAHNLDLPTDLDWIDEGLTHAYEPMASFGDTAQVHPYDFTKSMIALAQTSAPERVEVIQGAKAMSIEKKQLLDNEAERVTGVVYAISDSHTVHIPADVVILAAGPWSPELHRGLPVTAIRAHSIVIEPSAMISPHVLFTSIRDDSGDESTPEIYPRPHNRVYACGPGDEEPLPELAANVKISPDAISKLRKLVGDISRPLREGKVEIEQACYLPLGGPIIGSVENVQGLVIATGHTCWGICNAPATGKAVADLVVGGSLGKTWKLAKLEPRHFMGS
ncbi:hypothetical protein Clacol_008994 [Clathrus columnatus]|uniref:RRM domain-containing protein n=1 Tax=Clathrus columnatus TaxID=1419009 RepID=A0AAV5AM05_9AGAM|nr:hypothetical protein Clacol_008994 [Clathrus columnatus]